MSAPACVIVAGWLVVAALLTRHYRAYREQCRRTAEARRRLGIELARLEEMNRGR